MAAQIKAIETHYKGCRFRSRLEARWAVWLDHMGIRWHYEHEGYDLYEGRYLPDFWLPFPGGEKWSEGSPPVKGLWLEIKPVPMTEREGELLRGLSHHTRHVAYAFAGDPWPGEFAFYKVHPTWDLVHFRPPIICPMCQGTGIEEDYSRPRQWRDQVLAICHPAVCRYCGGGDPDPVDWFFFALHDFVANVCKPYHDNDGRVDISTMFQTACTAARSARFEHGESPR